MTTRKTPLSRCEDCPLLKNHGVYGRGTPDEHGHVDVLIVGEGPGVQEIQRKQVFIGPSGALLWTMMDKYHLGTFWLTNAALCQGYKAKDKEVAAECCRQTLLKQIEDKQPRLIITLGNIPTKILLGKGLGITKRRGILVQQQFERLIRILPTVHPAAVLRNGGWLPDFEADFALAERILSSPYPTAQHNYGRRISRDASYEVTEDFPRVLKAAEMSPFAVLDVESEGLDIHRHKLLGAVIATESSTFVLPGHVLYSQGFKQAFHACNAKWSGHNAKFDRNILQAQAGIEANFTFDTMLAHYLFDPRKGIHGLKDICRRLWGAPDWEAPIREMLKKKEIKHYGDIPRDILYKYAAMDGFWQYLLTDHLMRKLWADSKRACLFENMIMPAAQALSNAEIRGVQIDRGALARLGPKYKGICDVSLQSMEKIAGKEFNPRSPKQVAAIMFDELHIPMVSGRSTAAKTVLLQYKNPHPFVTELLRYREANTIQTRYVKGLGDHLSPLGRVHTSYNLFGTVTGRLSSSNPNLQNQPSRVASAKKDIRDLFLADEGMWWSEADFSNLETRMICLLSHDEYLTRCFQEGRDVHGETAAEVWGPNWTKEQRTKVKGIVFGLLYGRSEAGIVRDGRLQISMPEAKRISRIFFAKMPGVVAHNERIKRQVRRDGYIETPTGRIRYFPEVAIAHTRREWGNIYREAINTLPQSMASDATLLSLIELDRLGFDVRITVHDSVAIQGPIDRINNIAKDQCELMQGCAERLYGDLIPIPANAEIGLRWGSLEELEYE